MVEHAQHRRVVNRAQIERLKDAPSSSAHAESKSPIDAMG
jgi:hypothetical protein